MHRQHWGDKILQPWHVGGPPLAVPGTKRSPAKRIDPLAPADTNRSLQVREKGKKAVYPKDLGSPPPAMASFHLGITEPPATQSNKERTCFYREKHVGLISEF